MLTFALTISEDKDASATTVEREVAAVAGVARGSDAIEIETS
jgi:hypothetical protein